MVNESLASIREVISGRIVEYADGKYRIEFGEDALFCIGLNSNSQTGDIHQNTYRKEAQKRRR